MTRKLVPKLGPRTRLSVDSMHQVIRNMGSDDYPGRTSYIWVDVMGEPGATEVAKGMIAVHRDYSSQSERRGTDVDIYVDMEKMRTVGAFELALAKCFLKYDADKDLYYFWYFQ